MREVSGVAPQMSSEEVAARRAKARRTAWLLGFVALGFYVAFIVMSVLKG